MKTFLVNTDLDARVFDCVAAALQADDPGLSVISGVSQGRGAGPLQLVVLLRLKTQSSLASLMTTRNHIEALGAECRRLMVWRNLRSVTFVNCCPSPIRGADPGSTAVLLDAAAQTLPKRASIHLGMLDYSFDAQSRRVQNYTLYEYDEAALGAELLCDALTTALNAGASVVLPDP